VSKKALIVWGGWDGHQPKAVAGIFEKLLKEEGFDVTVSESLDSFNDRAKLEALNLIVPCWTAGTLSGDQQGNVCGAVASGVGIAGCHGGMCDAFRNACEYQFMTGGQWVAHPGNDQTKYTVKMGPTTSPITEGIKDFPVSSEQYYMHVDPAIKVLATTHFPVADGPHVGNGPLEMPVVWTKVYGKGKVFYSSLGHTPAVVEAEPHLTILRRGCNWAAK
jgi:type 1 glutamine amidotransferase